MLSALLLHPDDSLHVRELARLIGASPGSLHRELRLLADLGLLLRQWIGCQVHYRANQAPPIFAELSQLLRKTAGLADVLREALASLGDKVELAFVYGSIAAGTERPGSDVDLMVLGDASFEDLALALAPLQEALRRDVNPTVMTRSELAERLATGDGFARSVMKGEKLWVKGELDDLGNPAEDRSPEAARNQRRGAAPVGIRSPKPRRRSSHQHKRWNALLTAVEISLDEGETDAAPGKRKPAAAGLSCGLARALQV